MRYYNVLFFILQWQGKVQRCQQQFDDISSEIKREMERFELTRVKDFKANIIKYIEVQMAHQQQVIIYDKQFANCISNHMCPHLHLTQIISYWEAFAPFAREIV